MTPPLGPGARYCVIVGYSLVKTGPTLKDTVDVTLAIDDNKQLKAHNKSISLQL